MAAKPKRSPNHLSEMPVKHILVADDDPALRDLVREILEDAGYRVQTVADGLAATAALSHTHFDAVVSDIRMPGADGMQVLHAANRRSPRPPVILLTAFGTISGAVDAMRAGAFDYLTKPVESPAALRATVARAIAPPAVVATRPAEENDDVFVDPASRRLLEIARMVAVRDTTVLLLGESGVGKEVVARRIHDDSRRRNGPMIAFNCGAVPAELFEGQLFGHARGAFTGAHAARRGYFEEADGGTLLLDEVGELPLSAQVKLLRVLEERRITRLGEATDRPVDVRLIAATHRDLRAETQTGRFRPDLYYRLSVFPVEVPPLRARPGDIVPLAELFLRRAGSDRSSLSAGALQSLMRHTWPGNARELRNVIERGAILAGDGAIEARHLYLADAPRSKSDASGPAAASLKALEREAIIDALAASDGNRREAAAQLGIALRTLQYKLKEYGLTQRG